MSGRRLLSLHLHCLIAWKSILRRGAVLHMLHPPWHSFSFSFSASLCCFSPDCLHCAVQARLCHKCCRHVISLGPYHLSMTSLPFALAAVQGFSSFISTLHPNKLLFRHWSLLPLDPAPLSPLDDNGSIAWSVRTLVQYIKPNTWPGKLQSSLLGYFPGFTRLPLVIPMRPVVSPTSLSFYL